MKRKLLKLSATILLLVFLGNLMAFTLHPSLIRDPSIWLNNCLFSIGIGLPMVGFSNWLIRKFGDRLKWEVSPWKRITVTLGLVILVSILVTFLLNYIFILTIKGVSFAEYLRTTLNLLILQILIIIYIFSLLTGVKFFKQWKEGLIRQESMQRKAVELQMEALKNQVNPHFLFNSLNTLTSLVHKDPDKAVEFILQLSDIYRYVLEQRNQSVVDLQVEMKFVESYVQLQQMRFTGNIRVVVATGNPDQFGVVPLSVQMLVENAIKHNIVSADSPLEISLSVENGFLVVRNSLQPKSSKAYSESVGLENIRQQYEILTGRKVQIIQDNGFFTVRLPLIDKTKSHETADR